MALTTLPQVSAVGEVTECENGRAGWLRRHRAGIPGSGLCVRASRAGLYRAEPRGSASARNFQAKSALLTELSETYAAQYRR